MDDARTLEREISLISVQIEGLRTELEVEGSHLPAKYFIDLNNRIREALDRIYPEAQRLADLAAQKAILQRQLRALYVEMDQHIRIQR